MNIKKTELRFKREWAKVSKSVPIMPEITLVVAAESGAAHDLGVAFADPINAYTETMIALTGCTVITSSGTNAALRVPDEWTTAPTRLMFAATGQERLYNALLDVGIADWIDLHTADDGVNLIVDFLNHPSAEQIAALKRDYDMAFEDTRYTFAKHTTPLVDPAKVEAQVRQCWAGGHGGKIASIEPTTDPREWIVTTAKPVPANANLRNHGLALVKQIAPEVSHVRIIDELWSKLLQKPAPAAVTATTEAPIVADGDTQPIPEPVPEAAPSPELDERDLEINALKAQVENLYEIIRSLTPVTDEWQTVKITLPKDGKVIAHPEIAAEQAKGWDVHHVNYISNGEDRLYVLMVKRGKAKHEVTRHYAAGGYVTSGSPFMRRDTVVPVNGKGEWSIADAMIDAMNDELTPSMNALAAAFGVDLGAWR